MIKMATEAAGRAGIWAGICGEMAADLSLTPLLIGLGVEELSVGPRQLSAIRKALLSLSYEECRELADEALTLPTSRDILELSRRAAEAAYPDLLREATPF
jgi:phosphotransferase system enzyme I (PtsI)